MVYEALQAQPRRQVALKVMHAGLPSDTALRRFRDEAEILARLEHPGIATVYEAGVHDGLPFFALEYVEGARDLLEYVRAGELSARKRLELLAAVCDAVHYAHQNGVIHRDLKPANVLVDPAGRLRIIDFGIARRADAPADAVRAGTLPYMSPEQCEADARHVDVRSDVHALGVLLYEVLTDRLPWEIADLPISDALSAIREEAPARLPRRYRGDVEAIVSKAIARRPEDRYSSASALGDDLRRHLTDRAVEARQAGFLDLLSKFARRQRVAFASIAAVILISLSATVVSGWMAIQRGRAQATAEFEASVANISAASAALRVNDIAEARRCLDQAPEHLRGREWHHYHGRLDRSVRRISVPGCSFFAGTATDDGRLLATAGSTRAGDEISVWNAAAGIPLWTEKFPMGACRTVAFDRQRKRLAAGLSSGEVEIRDVETGGLLNRFSAHSDLVIEVAFDPEGRRLATVSRDRTVRLWDAATGEHLKTLTGHEDRVITVCFDPTGERLATGGREGTIRIWDVDSGRTVMKLEDHQGSVESVAFRPDGARLASASRDRTLRIRSLESGEQVAEGRGHTRNIRSLAFSPDGRTVATGSYDRTVRLWDAETGKGLAVLRGHEDVVKSVAIGSERIFSFSRDGTIRVWSPSAREAVPTLRGHRDQILVVAFSPDGRRLASGSRDGGVRIWNPDTGRTASVLPRAGNQIGGAWFGPESERLFVRTFDESILTWSLSRNAPVSRFLLRGAQGMTVGPRGEILYYGDVKGTVACLDLRSGRRIAEWQAQEGRLVSIGLDPSGRFLATGARDGTLGLSDVEGRRLLRVVRAHEEPIFDVAFGAGGYVATASRDGSVKVFDAGSLRLLWDLRHPSSVQSVSFSPDGTRIACGVYDGTVQLWDVPTGRRVGVLRGHDHPVMTVAFSPDGGRLATAGGEREGRNSVIRLWETEER